MDAYSEEEFRQNFRMFRTIFNHILFLIQDEIASHAGDNGRHAIYGKTQLLITLWYFGTPDCYR